MITVLYFAIALWATSTVYSLIKLFRNYAIARKIGFPIIWSPVNHMSIPWLVLAPMAQPWIVRYFPTWLYKHLQCGIVGWEFTEGWAPFADHSIHTYVSAGKIEIQVAEHRVAKDVWSWKDGWEVDPTAKSKYHA